MQPFDLIIVGGGLVGASLVAALEKTGLRIALIEAKEPNLDDPRLFALNASSYQFLKNMGISSLSDDATAIYEVHASYKGHFGIVCLKREALGLSALGQVIPAYCIETALDKRLSILIEKGQLSLYRPASLKKIYEEKEFAVVEITSKEGTITLRAPLVIGADGSASTVREELNIKSEVINYAQTAIVTRTILTRSHRHIAYERFNKLGAIAMLPLKDKECATIWTTEKAHAEELLQLSDADFLTALQAEFGYRLGRFKAIKARYHFPLRMIKAEKAHSEHILLLGNAAHTLHPIAAQGFNLALYEVAVLAETIIQMVLKDKKLDVKALLATFLKTESMQASSIGLSHRLAALFSGTSKLKDLALQVGMLSFELASPFKKHFIRKLLGRNKEVPRLLLSEAE